MFVDFSQITRIEDGKVFFLDDGVEKNIVLKVSANSWYESFHKSSFIDKIFRKKTKNVYAGIKNFCIDGMAYIKFYDKDNEYRFEMKVEKTNLDKKREEWERINIALHNQGYWLLDWS